jgi:hypothetical protein
MKCVITRPSRDGKSRTSRFSVFAQKLVLAAAFERFRFRLCDRRDNPVTLVAIVSSPSRPLWVIAERA